ncbi:MAG: hypothetical protein EOO41_03215 [Methanobacteriota archaeon]|nr:MAG: hypothetical protein EOO41_03215 [Euryarchaeota archaeon]
MWPAGAAGDTHGVAGTDASLRTAVGSTGTRRPSPRRNAPTTIGRAGFAVPSAAASARSAAAPPAPPAPVATGPTPVEAALEPAPETLQSLVASLRKQLEETRRLADERSAVRHAAVCLPHEPSACTPACVHGQCKHAHVGMFARCVHARWCRH